MNKAIKRKTSGNQGTTHVRHSVENKALSISGLRYNPYLPGITLFIIFLILGLFVYKDYGVSWDELQQRSLGLQSYNYIFHGDQALLSFADRRYGPGYELVLIFFEKCFGLTDTRDILLSRHLITHILFLGSCLSLYILSYRLFKDRFIASLGFIMLALAARLYAHSFFNTKDIPFLSLFLITLTVAELSFDKNKTTLFFILGMLCGYTSSIRIMGSILAILILLFLLIDFVNCILNKTPYKKQLLNIAIFLAGCCLLLYLAWPFLWQHPISNLIASVQEFAHYHWDGYILVNGVQTTGTNISWTYFPAWFLVTVPELWLISGFLGMVLLCIHCFKAPLTFLKNTRERQFLLYILCFFAPVLAVILLHSVVYNDWRHLYFVYPPFILIALFFINKILQTKYKRIVQAICALQIIFISGFMVQEHPFQQVYFNSFVSHAQEYLHNNYEMEYWGTSYKQGLEHLLATTPPGPIKVNAYYQDLVNNNSALLPDEDRARIRFTELDDADYFITNFWGYTYDGCQFNQVDYSISALNSTILAVYKVQKDNVSQKQYRDAKILELRKVLAADPDNNGAYSLIGSVFFRSAQYDSAEKYAQQAMKMNPRNIELINNMAVVYGVQKKYTLAIELYKKAIELNPGYAVSYTNTGLAYFYLGKHDSAVAYLNKAIVLDSNYNASYEILTATYKAKNIADSAKKYGTIASRRDPQFKL